MLSDQLDQFWIVGQIQEADQFTLVVHVQHLLRGKAKYVNPSELTGFLHKKCHLIFIWVAVTNKHDVLMG